MLLKISLLSLLVLLVSLASAKFRFDNYTLYKTLPKNADDIKVLQYLHDTDTRFDFWSDPVPNAKIVSVLSSPQNKAALEQYLSKNGIEFGISFSNIQEFMDRETVKPYTRGNFRSLAMDAYHTNDQINAWIDDLAAAYPNLVNVEIGGHSHEGRDIKGFRISHGPGRRIIFLEGGIHAREWISPAVIIYMANELLTSDDPEVMAAAREFDWYIFPVTNPDGYIWTHEEDRLWRKNRRPIGNQFGVDLNRNWNSNWLVQGSSTNPASLNYAGPGPFSEAESRTLSEYLRTISDRIDLYLSFHSAGQLLLIPFGNSTEPYANYDDAMNIGRRAMGALSVRYGTQYVTGNVAEAIYHCTGISTDWVKEHLNVPLTYTYELRAGPEFNHILPAEEILPSAEETFDSVLDIIHQAKRFGYMNSGARIQNSVAFMILGVIAAYLY